MAPPRPVLPGRVRAAVAALAAAAVQASAEGDDVCTAKGGCGSATELSDTNPEGYFWRRRGGGSEVVTSTPHVASVNLSAGPTWVWPNYEDEQVRHSPLIDDQKSIYIATAVKIRKFDFEGNMRWTWETGPKDGKMSTSPALYKGMIFAMAQYPPAELYLYCINMTNGRELWRTHHLRYRHADANSILAYNDTLVFASRDHIEDRQMAFGEDGNNQVVAASVADGKIIWDYTLDDVVWNFLPSTPGDGTLIFSSQCGRVYRLNWNGEALWKAGRTPPGGWCGCGGGVLGPNGLFYTEFNDHRKGQGVVAAHRVSDGSLVWERTWPAWYGGWQYPSVGRIAPSGRLAVVAPMGSITNSPPWPGAGFVNKWWVPDYFKNLWWNEIYLKQSWLASWVRTNVIGIVPLPNAVAALDAETGETIWWIDELPWDRVDMKGDGEGYIPRMLKVHSGGIDPTRADVICLPDPQGIPLVAGDGTVYASSSHSGVLAAIRDSDGDGKINPNSSEISVFDADIGFLNGPSLAPGMLVAAPCWGPVYIFKS